MILVMFGSLLGCRGLDEPLAPDCSWLTYRAETDYAGRTHYNIVVTADQDAVWVQYTSVFPYFVETSLFELPRSGFNCFGVSMTENITIAMGLSPEGPWCPLK